MERILARLVIAVFGTIFGAIIDSFPEEKRPKIRLAIAVMTLTLIVGTGYWIFQKVTNDLSDAQRSANARADEIAARQEMREMPQRQPAESGPIGEPTDPMDLLAVGTEPASENVEEAVEETPAAKFKPAKAATAKAAPKKGASKTVASEESAAPEVDPAALAAADALIKDASKKWGAGDYKTSLALAEKALMLRTRALGEDHPKVLEVQKMIDAANKKLDAPDAAPAAK